jgi:hypothetical protein
MVRPLHERVELLRMAIQGLNKTIEEAAEKKDWCAREMRRLGAEVPREKSAPQKAHRISAAGRARIAAAQRKRWADAKAGRPRSKAAAD